MASCTEYSKNEQQSHVINCAQRLLKAGATLILSGQKNDGIKTYVKQASQLFGNPVNADKKGSAYTATIQLNELDGDPLDDVKQLRPLKLTVNCPYKASPASLVGIKLIVVVNF